MMRLWWGFALRSSVLGLLAGSLWAQNEAFRAPAPPFEGVIFYKIKIRGPKAEILHENDPPTEMQIYIQGNRYLINEASASFAISRLYDPDTDWTYVLDPKNKRAFKYEKYRRKTKNVPAHYVGDSYRYLGSGAMGFGCRSLTRR